VIFTAGVTKRPASERSIIAVEFDGVVNTLDACNAAALTGRFMYMTSIGVTRRSIAAIALNLIKGRTLVWRRRAEEQIRASGLDYTIIRCGILRNAPPGRHAIEVAQRDYAMAIWYQLGRADAAELFVKALQHPAIHRTTFDAVWSRGQPPTDWDALLSTLRPDALEGSRSPE
jgi:uncharacterized protein YbjT (DUF2867 family)